MRGLIGKSRNRGDAPSPASPSLRSELWRATSPRAAGRGEGGTLSRATRYIRPRDSGGGEPCKAWWRGRVARRFVFVAKE